jgi:MFS family permease
MHFHENNSKKVRITRNVIALGIVSLFTDAATEMIYPLVPIFVTMLGSSAVILGVIEGVAETTASMLKLISGIVSDKIGKRKLLVVVGYGISTFVRPFTGAVSAAWQIVFVRMSDRIGKGIRTAPRDALIASSVDNRIRGKAYGFHRAMDHAGAVAGPFLARFRFSAGHFFLHSSPDCLPFWHSYSLFRKKSILLLHIRKPNFH